MQVLSDLQDRLQPFPTDQAMAVIEEELQASIGDVFSQLSAQPVAAASLGQVCHPVSCFASFPCATLQACNCNFETHTTSDLLTASTGHPSYRELFRAACCCPMGKTCVW